MPVTGRVVDDVVDVVVDEVVVDGVVDGVVVGQGFTHHVDDGVVLGPTVSPFCCCTFLQ